MQDLTAGPITKHLLKTTGFVLVQTLYFLIDLYWVGRLARHRSPQSASQGTSASSIAASRPDPV
jgi:hypothetical protein